MRKIVTSDIFAAARLVRVAGIKEDLIPIIAKAGKSGASVRNIGIEAILTIIEAASCKSSENAIYEWIGSVAECSATDIANMSPAEFVDLLEKIANNNEMKGFFDSVSRILTRK